MEMVLVDNNIMLICCILIPIYSANVYTAYVFVYRMLTYTSEIAKSSKIGFRPLFFYKIIAFLEKSDLS